MTRVHTFLLGFTKIYIIKYLRIQRKMVKGADIISPKNDNWYFLCLKKICSESQGNKTFLLLAEVFTSVTRSERKMSCSLKLKFNWTWFWVLFSVTTSANILLLKCYSSCSEIRVKRAGDYVCWLFQRLRNGNTISWVSGWIHQAGWDVSWVSNNL